MSDTDDHRDAVRMTQRHLQTATTGWSVGSFGVIAEFHRDADDTVDFTPTPGGGIAITDKGAVQVDLTDGVRVLPYETPSRNRARWNQGVNICLPNGPAGRMAARTGLTEVGPDVGAVRELDRNAILFDLGLALPHVDACVRTADPALIETLRAHPGADMLDFDGPAMAAVIAASPHRVFLSRLGRVEVYQYIPSAANGLPTPQGPHTHLLPKLAAHGRTHAANVHLPDAWLPCLSVYPANPLCDGMGQDRPFDAAAHDEFQAIVQRFGPANHRRLKRRVADAVRQGVAPMMPGLDREHRALVRACLRQLRCTDGDSQTLDIWREAFEPSADEPPQSDDAH